MAARCLTAHSIYVGTYCVWSVPFWPLAAIHLLDALLVLFRLILGLFRTATSTDPGTERPGGYHCLFLCLLGFEGASTAEAILRPRRVPCNQEFGGRPAGYRTSRRRRAARRAGRLVTVKSQAVRRAPNQNGREGVKQRGKCSAARRPPGVSTVI